MNTDNTELPKTGRDGHLQSPWQAGVYIPDFQTEQDDPKIYDVLIIGAGITGMTAGLLLQQAGKQCLLVDAHQAGFGTTGGTSAHINTFADTSYSEAESAFGEDGAKLFAQAINEGYRMIKDNVTEYEIDCDLQIKQGFVYAENEEEAKELDELYEGAVKADVPVRYTDYVPGRIAYRKAIVFDGQAQFHPLKYLSGLQTSYLEAGGAIRNNTIIISITTEDGIHTATTGTKKIKAKQVIYATHVPPGINVFSLRCAPYRSYVLGVTLTDDNYPEALVYDMQEPYHYVRTHELNGQKYLIVGGCDHKTGHGDPEQAFKDLELYIYQHYSVAAIVYKWSSQYYVPVDGFPYIGQMPGLADGIYCATGYNGNGMMLGTLAGKMLCDAITGKESPYADIFKPSRIKPLAGFKEFIKENTDVVYQFVTSQFRAQDVDSLKQVQTGSGKVIEINGRQIAVYRDNNGECHAVSPVCTHAQCVVNWNSEEKSWDCPCHGARYDIDGSVLNGPADKALEKVIL